MVDLRAFGGTDSEVSILLEKQQGLRAEGKQAKKKLAERYPIPRHQTGEYFIKGPVPCVWLEKALSIGGKSGNVCWAIWWRAGVEQKNPVRLTAQVWKLFGVAPKTANRLLVDFESAGLVLVDRCQGRGPIITLLTLRCANSDV